MTSSNSCELTLRQGSRVLSRVRQGSETVRDLVDFNVSATSSISVSLDRPETSRTRGELLVGDEIHLVVRPLQGTAASTIPPLREEFGEVIVRYREYDPDDPESGLLMFEVAFEVEGEAPIRFLFERLVTDLEQVHLGLAREVLGQSGHRTGSARADPRIARPEEDCQALESVLLELDGALARIQRQPVRALTRRLVRDRWRPGDRLTSSTTLALLQEPDTVVVGLELRRIGRMRVQRSYTTLDIPEHRILRHEVGELSQRARRMAGHCAACIEHLRLQRIRWGGERSQGSTVFETEYLPRIQRYESLALRAEALSAGFDRLRQRADFLQQAGDARSELRPTPLFLNGRGYREAYAALRASQRMAAPLVSGDEFRLHFRSLSRLFEYWCFVQVVECLRSWLGKPVPYAEYQVVDEVYRPDLRSGQWFQFPLRDQTCLRVHYEPDIIPWDWDHTSGHRFRATLSSAPLRPDVLVELDRPGLPPIALVLDAKSSARFTRQALWSPTDYRARVIDSETGLQPIRQAFFLHRDEHVGILENIPGYLAGARGDATCSVIGGVACLPWSLGNLRQILRRFILLNCDPPPEVTERIGALTS